MQRPNPWNDPAFVAAYCERVQHNAYNALYERPALQALLLDAGCAGGALSKWLQEQGAEVHAIDSSPLMIAHLKQSLGDEVNARVADLAKPLDFEDQSLDVLISSLSLHYLEDWGPTLREFQRILKPGGPFVFSTHHPSADFLHSPSGDYEAVEYMEEEWRGFAELPVRVGFYRRPLSAILMALSQAGFQVDSIVEPKPLPLCHALYPETYSSLLAQPAFLLFRCSSV